jgi:hypothetical protein
VRLISFLCVGVLALVILVGCGGGDSGPCGSFCAKDAECFSMNEIVDCAQWCRDNLDEGARRSAECEAAVADVYACVADLSSCEEVEAWHTEVPADSYPCKAADDRVRSICF